LWISGFLKDDEKDDALKYELTVQQASEAAVLSVLGWRSVEESPDGEWLLSHEHAQQIANLLNEHLPAEFDLFISVRK
jgi:hypothetical protein